MDTSPSIFVRKFSLYFKRKMKSKKCKNLLKRIACTNSLFSQTPGETATLKVTFISDPDSKLPPITSYFNVQVTAASPIEIPSGTYSAWCASFVNDIVDGTYQFTGYSLLDPAFTCNPSNNSYSNFYSKCNTTTTPAFTNNFPAINTIINKAQCYENSGALMYDIQVAIWSIIHNNITCLPYTGPLIADKDTSLTYTPSIVYSIINDALCSSVASAVCTVPQPSFVLLLIPTPANPCIQPLFLQIPLC